MYYLIYKITNNVNNKYYIGQHRTKNINDSYMGSGIRIKAAILKYGIQNFTKDILHYCDNEKSLNEMERYIVNEELLNDPLCYNLSIGGTYVQSSKESYTLGYENGISKLSLDEISLNGKVGGERTKLLYGKTHYSTMGSLSWRNRTSFVKTEEHKKLISSKLSGVSHGIGQKHNYPKNRKTRESPEVKLITCPHCNKTGNSMGMKRWHFDNCKIK